MLTITIPCYNQPELLRRCLSSLCDQTFKDFVVQIIDDNSQADYTKVISEFENLNIIYTKNDKNLGAIGNIFNSITFPVNNPYILSLHEDDTLHHDYLRVAIEILEKDKEINFLGSNMSWFKDENELLSKKNTAKKALNTKYKKLNQKQFVLEILKGIHFGLGSVIYRSEITTNKKPDLEKYSVLCDRPFLVDLVENRTCAIILDFGMYVRDHGKDDNRGDNIKVSHLTNLLHFYQSFIRTKDEFNIFYKHSTNNVLYSYHRLASKNISFLQYIKIMRKEGLLKFKYIKPQGLLGLWLGFTK